MRAVVLPTLLTSSDSSWDVAYASMLVVVEANLIIICGMLPTLRKFFRHVAPKIIGESTYARGQGSKSGGAHYKSSNSSPPIVTFGSIPSSHKCGHGHNHRGYAKFDEYAFALETIGGSAMYPPYEERKPFPGDGVVGVFRTGSKKGRVDTTVVAGGGVDEAGGTTIRRGGGGVGSFGGRNSLGSRDSQLPIMGGGGGTGGQSSGITATTRIEVSYDRAGSML